MSFKDLGLVAGLIKNVSEAGYTHPTEIQKDAIPSIIQGKDLLGIAQTGTGKTAAFCLPILHHLLSTGEKRVSGMPRALIITPTRELCSQIDESIKVYAKDLDIRSVAIYGGVGQKEQATALRNGVDIVVATPGRLLDLLEQRLLRVSGTQHFVLDEADRMLDMGFSEDIDEIIHRLPGKKQTMLFSATMPPYIAKLAHSLLKNPVTVQVTPQSTTVEKIEQKIIFCRTPHKFQLLKKILKEEAGLTLVFTTSKVNADLVVEYLLQNRIPTGAIHADKKQIDRERHLANFRDNAIKVLVATDIASRGIDIDGVTHVINFDLPLSAETYVHRIGRTGRAGNEGKAISFCDETEMHLLDKIKRALNREIPTEKFEGKFEELKMKASIAKKATPPTPGKNQEKTAYLDHSKRQKPVEEGAKKRVHPGFKKTSKKRK
jgi:ATP-dependent RNA helicase RhlE